MQSHTLIGGAILLVWPGEIPPTRQLCKKREGLVQGKNQEAYVCFIPTFETRLPPMSNRTCLTLGLDRRQKNGQIVIMLYAFQDILAKYLNSHLPVIVETTPV